jgi:hypothetical protein
MRLKETKKWLPGLEERERESVTQLFYYDRPADWRLDTCTSQDVSKWWRFRFFTATPAHLFYFFLAWDESGVFKDKNFVIKKKKDSIWLSVILFVCLPSDVLLWERVCVCVCVCVFGVCYGCVWARVTWTWFPRVGERVLHKFSTPPWLVECWYGKTKVGRRKKNPCFPINLIYLWNRKRGK